MNESPQDKPGESRSELSDPLWAVISFDRCEATDLTYEQASAKLAELQDRRIPGLAVVTAETAARVRP